MLRVDTVTSGLDKLAIVKRHDDSYEAYFILY